MIQKLSQRYKIPGIHIVHRNDLKEALINEGFERVLDSSSKTFEEDLKNLCEELNVRYAMDCVAGSMTGLLAKNLPSKSQVVVYGVLSGKKCEVDPGDLIFRGIQVTGFWLSDVLKERNPLKAIKLLSDLKKHLKMEVATVVNRKISFNEIIDEIKCPKGSSSFGKTLVVPN
jgi:NADPH:quinone reductase-like Zn-dependent oxidoreductase